MRMLLVLLVLLSGVSTAFAESPPRYNQIHLQSQHSEQVTNDTLQVSLHAFAEMQDSARLADRINQEMAWALTLAKQFTDVKISTGNYQVWPITRKNVTTGWRGQQDLRLESRDTEKLSRLTAQLQEKLKIKSMNFSVSDEKRMAVENRLIDVALNAFKERARIIKENLKATGYRIVDITIGTSAQRPPVLYQARMAASAMQAESAVAVAGGESDIRVTVNGAIELQMP